MKVVLDTNVVVSGLITRTGACATILDLLVGGTFKAVLDARIMDEYQRVCAEPRLNLDSDAVRELLRLLEDVAERVAAAPLKADAVDSNDLPFLEVATGADAVLVTGNKKHFPRRVASPVLVMSPREFLDMLRA
jgi:putative PIN family toxin of toxin-antitoxin system